MDVLLVYPWFRHDTDRFGKDFSIRISVAGFHKAHVGTLPLPLSRGSVKIIRSLFWRAVASLGIGGDIEKGA